MLAGVSSDQLVVTGIIGVHVEGIKSDIVYPLVIILPISPLKAPFPKPLVTISLIDIMKFWLS